MAFEDTQYDHNISYAKGKKVSKCALCGQSVGEFRDELSSKEFAISGMCQSCQDDVFGNSNG